MKRTVVIVVLIACTIVLALGSIVNAQQSTEPKVRPYSFFVAGHLPFAISPDQFTSYYRTGLGGAVGIEYPVSPSWSILGFLDHVTFSPSEGAVKAWWTEPDEWPSATNIKVSEGGVSATTIAVVSKGMLKSKGSTLFPYIKGGFGISFGSVSQVKVTFDTPYSTGQVEWMSVEGSRTIFSIILGVGAEKSLGAGSSALFADVGLHMILYEDLNPTLIPLTFGIKF